jgi:hypothetical protein
METLRTLETVLIGLGMRIGLPLAVTALATWLLLRLDRHWQEQARTRRAQLAVGAARHSVRCWEENDCSAEKRASCPAYARQNVPCWQAFRETTGRMPEQCLGCSVFRNAPVPAAVL